MKPAIFALPFLLLSFAPAPPSPPRDIIPPGMHGVHFVLSVDASAVSACLCRAYKIEPGDTIDEIAKRECGDARCADEIRLMNPEVSADKLSARDRLRIPPRASAPESRATSRSTDAAGGCRVLLTVHWWPWGAGGTASVIVEGEPIDVPSRGQVRIVAVPREKLLWFLRLPLNGVSAETPIDGVMCSDVIVPAHLVPEADPTVTIEDRVTLKNGKDQRIVFEIERCCFDKNGKLLARSAAGRLLVASLPVAAIGLLALVGIVGLARRRRRS